MQMLMDGQTDRPMENQMPVVSHLVNRCNKISVNFCLASDYYITNFKTFDKLNPFISQRYICTDISIL